MLILLGNGAGHDDPGVVDEVRNDVALLDEIANFHVALQDYAVKRCANIAIPEIQFCPFELRAGCFQLGQCLCHLRIAHVAF